MSVNDYLQHCSKSPLGDHSDVSKQDHDHGCKFAHLHLLFCCVFFFFSLERPKIYEKETDFDKIVRVELRSKHKISCTASGNPDPKVEWKWQPCSLADML